MGGDAVRGRFAASVRGGRLRRYAASRSSAFRSTTSWVDHMSRIALSLFAIAVGCGKPSPAAESAAPTAPPTKPMARVVSMLGKADEDRLSSQRKVVDNIAAACLEATVDLASVQGRLTALQAILDAKHLTVSQAYELQCLGIVFGDALVGAGGLEWVMVDDEYGRDPALRIVGSDTLLFPMTMLSKRVERGEAIDVAAFFQVISQDLDKRRSKG